MISAIPTNTEITASDLMNQMVCSTESKLCMIHRCPNCPGPDAVIAYLEMLCDVEDVKDSTEIVHFKQWIITDHTNLEESSKTLPEFCNLLAENIEKLTSHHFIAKSQSSYLNKLRESLPEDEAILILDFAENYSFIVQDAVQGFHWENTQATLHPFVAYSVQDGEVKPHCMCVISDCLQHDNVTVNTFQKTVISHMKTKYPHLKKIHYFSDGAASQYKNYKNFANLVCHEEDFGLSAEWNFFATSHGKNACDGVGGTIKREAAKASLQAVTSGHLLTPQDLYEWGSSHIKNVTFFFVTREEVKQHSESQNVRFSNAKTVPGTREYHCFIPTGNKELSVKRISADDTAIQTTAFIQGASAVRAVDTEVGQYVGCMYDEKWWVGYVIDKSEQEYDLLIKFMHPHGPARSFHWPPREDKCWVPKQCILCCVEAPITTNGRQYHLQADDKLFLSRI